MQKFISILTGAAGRLRARFLKARDKAPQAGEASGAKTPFAWPRIRLPKIKITRESLKSIRFERRSARAMLRGLGSQIVDLGVTLLSMLRLVFKRLRHNMGLSISALLGIVAVLGIVVCVPVFSFAVSSEVLREQLEEKSVSNRRSLFSQHMYFQDKREFSELTVENSEAVTRYIWDQAPRQIGVRGERLVTELQTRPIRWNPLNLGEKADPNEPYITMGFLSLDVVEENSVLVEGSWPKPSTKEGEVIQVAVMEKAADALFLNVGDRFVSGPIEIEISGIWMPGDSFHWTWFNYPDTAYKDMLYIPYESFRERLKIFERPIFYMSWYMTYDENDLRFQRAGEYARGMVQFDSNLRRVLAGVSTDYTPLEALSKYQERANTLSTLLYAVGGPMVVLALLFIALTASIAVQQYEQETATMRGRGTSWPQIVTLNLTESVALVLVALPFSLLVGLLEAMLMGSTVSFLKFTGQSNLAFSLDGVNVAWLVAGSLVVILARFLPVLGLSRTTIVRMKQEQSRATRKPLWERFYLDFILLIPGIYAYVTMSGLAKPVEFLEFLQPAQDSQYRDPLLFVAPALFAMALCMIIIRILPFVMRLLAILFDRMPGVWSYLSLQQIARRPQDHSSALLLIMISLSLSIYSASTAKTLDKWQYDSLYYKAGSDLAIHEYVLQTTGGGPGGPGGGGTTTVSEMDLSAGSFVNIDDHLKLPSVEGATRVGKYNGSFSYGVGEERALIMGIDRQDFPGVAFYRDDFASESFGSLMNALGLEPEGVLLPKTVLEKIGLRIGDRLNVAISVLGEEFERDLVIVGHYDYFPTVFPTDAPTLVVNLDSIFDNPDSALGYDIWLRIREDTDTELLFYQIRQLIDPSNGMVEVNGNAYDDLRESIELPERKGVFGVLNVGFIATGLMPGIGFVLYSYASMRRRFIQLGILQAIGLSVGQLIGYLVLEQFLLMGMAIVLGAAIGLISSYLFVPFLQVSTTGGGAIPPFEVLIGWAESGWLSLAFGLVLLMTMLGTIWYLAQIKVFQAVKMGETF